MLTELLMFFCEPDVPFEDSPVRKISLIEESDDGMSGFAEVYPPVVSYYGKKKGISANYLLLQPRWKGHSIESVKENYGVMYITPIFDDELKKKPFFSKHVSLKTTEPMGYCVISSSKIAKEKFDIVN